MQIMQSRRDFLASVSRPAPRASLAPGDRSPTRRRRKRPRSGLRRRLATSVSRPRTSPRTCCARKGSPISATCRHRQASRCADGRTRRDRLRPDLRAHRLVLSPGCRRADHGAGGRASRLLRAVRARAHPHHQRPEGQEGRHRRASARRAPVRLDHGGTRRARPRKDIDWVTQPRRQADGAVRRAARSMPSSASRPSRRSCAPARSVA